MPSPSTLDSFEKRVDHQAIYARSPRNDDADLSGIIMSCTITVLTIVGLLFCFRRASRLMPSRLAYQLRDLATGNNSTKGPIALPDDDDDDQDREFLASAEINDDNDDDDDGRGAISRQPLKKTSNTTTTVGTREHFVDIPAEEQDANEVRDEDFGLYQDGGEDDDDDEDEEEAVEEGRGQKSTRSVGSTR